MIITKIKIFNYNSIPVTLLFILVVEINNYYEIENLNLNLNSSDFEFIMLDKVTSSEEFVVLLSIIGWEF